MESTRLLRYINNSDLLSDPNALSELESAVKKYPFFTVFQMLYLKALRLHSKFNYNLQLRLASIHAKDRARLFYYMNSQLYDVSLLEEEEEVDNTPEQPKSEEILSQTRIQSETLVSDPVNQGNNLTSAQVENFISRSDSYKKVPSSGEEKGENEKLDIDKSLYTETLANLFMDQKKYEQALEAYEYLILKHPEKKAIFEKKIESIKSILQSS